MNDSLKPYIALFLKAHRLNRNWTYEKAAASCHVSASMIELFESGQMITLDTIWYVAQPYQIKLSKIFEFAEVSEQFGIDSAFKSEAPYLVS